MTIENKIDQFENRMAQILSHICYHIHPDIVSYIQKRNVEERDYFVTLFDDHIDLNCYLYSGSACVFPGVRRFRTSGVLRQAYSPIDRAIRDDNTFPRHLWCFLRNGRSYNSDSWKKGGLNEFELAHIFSHKPNGVGVETRFFKNSSFDLEPFGNFSCAANVIILPKGTAKPTDHSIVIKSVFFKRYVDLYGEKTLCGRFNFDEKKLPTWYDTLSWNDPFLPADWLEKVEELMEFRKKKLEGIMERYFDSLKLGSN